MRARSQGVGNSVNASGLVLDASAARSPVQEVDLDARRIGNEITFPLIAGAEVIVRVAGGCEPDAAVGRRANVDFDTLDVFLAVAEGAPRRLLRAGGLFSVVRALRPSLMNGPDEANDRPWLDTTYISEQVRLGRGNKGSVFVLERLDDSGGRLAQFPL